MATTRRRNLCVSSAAPFWPLPKRGDLVFDPFCGSGTTGVAAKELGRFFVGAEMEEEFAQLAARRIGVTERGSILSEISG